MSTPYLNMDLPVVSVTPGPEWAEQLNQALEVIDDHDHSSGKGRPITSAALNINDDVSINNFNLTTARSYNMQDQSVPLSGPTDVRSLYSSGGELYYNDSVGNQVRITLNGALDATSIGGIGGDYGTSTASVTYNSTSKTFFFYQNTNQSAKMDVGDLIIHETVAGANGITLKSPSSLAAAYTITLPAALPASNLMLQMSTVGVLTPAFVATSHIDPAGLGSAAYATGSVGTTAIADDSVTAAKVDPNGGFIKLSKQVFSAGAGTYPLLIPIGVDRIFVKGCGGGGGGGYTDTTSDGGGGGAGAQIRTDLVTAVPATPQTFAPGDVDISTEEITITAHGYIASQAVVFSTTGTLPGGISASTVYYVRSPAANLFQISTTPGGSALNITSQGTGTHTVRSAYAVVIGAGGAAAPGVSTNGSDGGETYLSFGPYKVARFPGGDGGKFPSGGPGVGGADFTWENQSTPGGNGGSAGSNPVNGNGIGGTATGSGGGGGGSIGNGGNGGNTGLSQAATAGTLGGGGGGGGGGTATAAGAGGAGYLEVLYWENINPA